MGQKAPFHFDKRSENPAEVVEFEDLSSCCSKKLQKYCLVFSYSFIYFDVEKISPPFQSFETETDLKKKNLKKVKKKIKGFPLNT